MKKKLFKTSLLSFAAFCGLTLAFASCANEDVAQGATGTETENDKNLTTFVVGDEAKTRTSMDYTSGDFYWEAGDHIYVKDDNNVWRKSSNSPTGKVASFKFKVPGKFTASTSYKVYYPGKNSNNDQVTIPAVQSQSEPNSTTHFGVSGDCGVADATGTAGGGVFSFRLDHRASYLVFQPYTSNTVLYDCYLTKIEIISDNDITDTYTLNPLTGILTGSSGTGKQIVLITGGGSSSPDGFPLTNSSASVTTNGAYMVIKPGTHTLKVRYWVKDLVTHVEGTITKQLPSTTYSPNTYYDMTANLSVHDYNGDNCYQWDALQQYWYGYEWTKNLPSGIGQPTLLGQPAGKLAQNNTDPRYYHEGSGAFQATQSCASLPNVNEMVWYASKGDPRWDGDELWSTMGHLYKGGVWFKKKAYISGYNVNTAPDGTDWRINDKQNYWSVSYTLPSAADASKYFYLPVVGSYSAGQLDYVGIEGNYWSSSSHPMFSSNAYSINFNSSSVRVVRESRIYGFRIVTFE